MRWIQAALLCGLVLGGQMLPGQDVDLLTPPPRPRGRELAVPTPVSLRGLPEDELLAYLGIGLGAWKPDYASGPQRDVVPEGILEMTPRAAAHALVEANLEPWERTVLSWKFDETPPLPTAKAGWLLIRLGSGPRHDGIYYVPYGPQSGPCYAFSFPPLGLQEASVAADVADTRRRWLAETVGWMRRLRVTFRNGVSGINHPIFAHSTSADVSVVEQSVQPEETVAIAGVFSPWLSAPFPEALVSRPIFLLLRQTLGLPARPATDADPKLSVVEEGVRAMANDPKVTAPMLVEVVAYLATQLEFADLVDPLETLAARSERAFPAARELHEETRRALGLVRSLNDPEALVRQAGERSGQERRDVLQRLYKVAPARALELAERTLRGTREPDWYEWNFVATLSKAEQSKLLLPLIADLGLLPTRRAKCEAVLVGRDQQRKADPAAEKRLATFLGDASKPPELRVELTRVLLFADSREPLPSADSREALASIVADQTDASPTAVKMRAAAALALGSCGDLRALQPLLKRASAHRDALHTNRELIVLGCLAASASPAERRNIVKLFEEWLRAGLWSREIADAAWLANFRELTKSIERFANWRTVGARTSGGGPGSSADARRLILTWREPDRMTRAQLEIVTALETPVSYFVARPLMERRVREIAASFRREERAELAKFTQRIVQRLRDEVGYGNEFACDTLRAAGLMVE